MTKQEFDEAAALVVRLRKELEHTNQHLVAHIDALTKSNAQCGEYLRRNEQLHSELVEVRAALAATTEQRDSLQRTLDEWERADTMPHTRIDEVTQVVPVCPCPQPLKPHGMTWQQLDNALANQQPVPMCTTCHGCGSVLYPSPAGDYFGCGDLRCTRSNTKHWHPGCTIGPYAGPCKSTTPVRHE